MTAIFPPACSRRKLFGSAVIGRSLVLLVLLLGCTAAAAAQQLALSIADLKTPAFSVKRIRADLRGKDWSRLELHIGELSVQGKTWREIKLSCRHFQITPSILRCDQGELVAGDKLPLQLHYDFAHNELDVRFFPVAGESWHLRGRFAENWQAELVVANGKLARIAAWLPHTWLKLAAGAASGKLHIGGNGQEIAELDAMLRVDGVGFSDDSGLHAAEKLGGNLALQAQNRRGRWQWSASLEWDAGELFWQPLYLTGIGHRLALQGSYADGRAEVASGRLALAQIGSAEFSAAWQSGLRALDLRAGQLDLAGLYRYLLKPFFANNTLGDLRAEGKADLAWRIEDATTQSFSVALHHATLADNQQRFALFGLDAKLPWQRDAPMPAELSFERGEVWRLALGKAQIPLIINGHEISVADTQIPLLDGVLALDGFSARLAADGWQWQVGAELAPVSMERLSQTLGWPTMHGSLSGVVPRLEYARSALQVQGALVFNVFDGAVVAHKLQLLDPFGRAPRLYADVNMSNLDLDLLTRTFSFGNITGRIDVRVEDLQLSNWQPVRFVAALASSPGNYPKTISQTAVQNISALGGAGAAAAIQRSFLRFFERFGYAKIGLSCALKNGVCRMDGIETLPHGYRIVKGGGIPAITVMGYNRDVSWQELLTRLQRITQSNVQPIVQ